MKNFGIFIRSCSMSKQFKANKNSSKIQLGKLCEAFIVHLDGMFY